ncbi:hypothetical protein UPYG_G00060390 [Umbra pygmaea]|uniref:Ig-like domain-containing protein n=1 Tax=Umbra pygmaea TaxID=75934 RepID=A0ABD0XC99_UMBPY
MSLRTTGSVLMVFLCSVTVVLVQHVWSVCDVRDVLNPGWGVTYTTKSICVLKGSTVNLSCSYMYPSGHRVNTTFWFTKCDNPDFVNLMNDSDYTGRVKYSSNQINTNTLTITDLRLNDSAIYWFRFLTNQPGGKWNGYPGVNLTVTGIQGVVTSESTSNTLTCKTMCTPPGNHTYIWYKNGKHIDESTSPQYKTSVYSNYEDSYSCAVKGHEDLHSPVVWKAVVGVTVFVLVLICLSGFMCFRQRRKTASKSTSYQEGNTRGTADFGQVGSSPVYEIVSSKDMTSNAAQTANTENQEDLHYASVHFSSSKNQEVPLYSTNQKLEEDVQYAAVNCSAYTLPPNNEDPSMIYSTVHKPRDKRT